MPPVAVPGRRPRWSARFRWATLAMAAVAAILGSVVYLAPDAQRHGGRGRLISVTSGMSPTALTTCADTRRHSSGCSGTAASFT
jgi:hypothetical protein